MDVLVTSLPDPIPLKEDALKSSSQLNESDNKNQASDIKIPDQTPKSTSTASSKCEDNIEIVSSPLNPSHVVTKGEAVGSKDIKSCFCCFWEFPQSFRGEEKNTHIDRCMEGLGEKDKQLWARCHGDLKQYKFGFGAPEPKEIEKEKKPKTKRIDRKNKDEEESNPSTSRKSSRKAKVMSESQEINLKTEDVQEKPLSKKKKLQNTETNSQQEKATEMNVEEQPAGEQKEQKEQGELGYTKILYLPLVTDLIFNPTKEFDKFLRKKKDTTKV